MIYIENDIIFINRSDDGMVNVDLVYETGDPYVMDEGDILTFTVRKKPSKDSEVLLEKQSSPGLIEIAIDSSDTSDLEVGLYSADIQLVTAHGKRITVWPKLKGSQRSHELNFKNFCLMPEVTRT